MTFYNCIESNKYIDKYIYIWYKVIKINDWGIRMKPCNNITLNNFRIFANIC